MVATGPGWEWREGQLQILQQNVRPSLNLLPRPGPVDPDPESDWGARCRVCAEAERQSGVWLGAWLTRWAGCRLREGGLTSASFCQGQCFCLHPSSGSDLSLQPCWAFSGILALCSSGLSPEVLTAGDYSVLFRLPGQVLHPVPATEPQEGFLSALPTRQPPG